MVLFIFFSSHIAQLLSQRHGRYQRPLTSQPRRRRAGPLNPYLHRSHPSQRNETLKHVASTLVMPLLDRIQVLFFFFLRASCCRQRKTSLTSLSRVPTNITHSLHSPLPRRNPILPTLPSLCALRLARVRPSACRVTEDGGEHSRYTQPIVLPFSLSALFFFSFPRSYLFHPSGPSPDMRAIPSQG